jgi:DNA-binding transcriptional ArsR family regulator
VSDWSPILLGVDEVFRALADPSRRVLLDQLFDEDGQTLSSLVAALPSMTRFGVMKHLQVLEDAGLVTTQKIGREKRHYLNPVPIRLVHDRWIAKYAEPWVRGLADLKHDLESKATTKAKPKTRTRKNPATSGRK